jgi:hypothetical protein
MRLALILTFGLVVVLIVLGDAESNKRKLAECVNVCAMFQQTADGAITCARKCARAYPQ